MELNFRFFRRHVAVKSSPLPMSSVTPGTGTYGGFLPWRHRLPGAKVDYRAQAQDAWLNTIVGASVGWVGRNLPQASPCLYEKDAEGNETPVHDHPLVKLLKRPNKYYDGKTLLQATFLSLMSGRGNAYWWIRYANDGTALELWYIPHFAIWPVWKADATTDTWIAGYQYRQAGRLYFLTNEEVLHFRDGMDPYQLRLGLDPLGAAYRELVGDNESSGYYVSVLKNMGILPLVISPADGAVDLSDADKAEIKAMFEDVTTGDNRGRPALLTNAVKLDQFGLTPNDMMLDRAAIRPESRICALTGVNAVVLGLQSGLEHSTYANMEEARRAAWQDGIVPRLELINAELTHQLLPAYSGVSGYDSTDMIRVGTDYSRVPALQENKEIIFNYLSNAVKAGWIAPNDARHIVGMDEIEGGESLVKAAAPAGAQDDDADDPNAQPQDDKGGRQGKPPNDKNGKPRDKTPTNGHKILARI